MRFKKLLIFFVLVISLSGCKEELTRDKAKEILIAANNLLVLNANELNDSMASLELIKTTQGYELGIAQEQLAQIYQKMGFIEQYDFQSQTYVRLTEKGRKEVRELLDSGRTMDVFALSDKRVVDWKASYAYPKLVDVTGVSADSDTIETFEAHYVWEPNELGKLIQEVKKRDESVIGVSYLPNDIYASGKMRYYDDGWRLESLEADNASSSLSNPSNGF